MTQPLIQWDTVIVSSIYKNIQNEVIAQGYMPDVNTFGTTQAEAVRYLASRQTVIGSLGFEIEVFNDSSARRKAKKQSPRIVIYLSKTYPGDIGAPTHSIISNDVNISGPKFTAGIMPQQATNLSIAIHLISSVSKQKSILSSILANSIGQRKYLPYWDLVDNVSIDRPPFLAEQISCIDADYPVEGVFEKIYNYTVPDIYLSGMANTYPVSEIKYIQIQAEAEEPFTSVGAEQP